MQLPHRLRSTYRVLQFLPIQNHTLPHPNNLLRLIGLLPELAQYLRLEGDIAAHLVRRSYCTALAAWVRWARTSEAQVPPRMA